MRQLSTGIILFIILSLLAFEKAYAQPEDRPQTDQDTLGYADFAQGDLDVRLRLSPPAARPGATIQVNVAIHNNGSQLASPIVFLPQANNLVLRTGILPAATSYDMVSRSLGWQPAIPGGESREINLAFEVVSADLNNPLRPYSILLVHEGERHEIVAEFWVGVTPTAELHLSHFQVAIGQPVRLVSELTGPGPFSHTWDLGDGRLIYAENPTVVYGSAGSYEIGYQAANLVSTVQVTTTIEVLAAPTAFFTLSDPTPGPGQTIQFLNESGGQPPLQYRWDFGDGQTSQEHSPSHLFEQAGDYRVSLIVESPVGANTFVWPLTVGDPPSATIVDVPDTVIAGETVLMAATGDGSIREFAWDMGDGATYKGQQVSHQFVSVGEFYVWLLATNDYGTSQIGQWINVLPNADIEYAYLPLLRRQDELLQTSPTNETIESNSTAITVERQPDIVAFEEITLPPAPLPESATEAEELFWYLNEARRLHNLPPLAYVHVMSVAALRHAEDMVINQFTGHTGTDGSRPFDRLPSFGYTGKYAGEATAWGHPDAKGAVEFWVNSSGHRRIILNPNASEVGVGYAFSANSPSVWYWVAEFGTALLEESLITEE